ncbi:hypothetical protein KP509_33G034200 [Ceratopteris richardii]|uniref:Uncharacterized protein n=1 Tax=Ceratopteris richardii TaxID=49495 RepID=A0A8T2QPL1_CERRI|nr:hypothetical protein KP509_33G034200 [Ceratopteris richardii]
MRQMHCGLARISYVLLAVQLDLAICTVRGLISNLVFFNCCKNKYKRQNILGLIFLFPSECYLSLSFSDAGVCGFWLYNFRCLFFGLRSKFFSLISRLHYMLVKVGVLNCTLTHICGSHGIFIK